MIRKCLFGGNPIFVYVVLSLFRDINYINIMHIRLGCLGILYYVHGHTQGPTHFEYYDIIGYLLLIPNVHKNHKKA